MINWFISLDSIKCCQTLTRYLHGDMENSLIIRFSAKQNRRTIDKYPLHYTRAIGLRVVNSNRTTTGTTVELLALLIY